MTLSTLNRDCHYQIFNRLNLSEHFRLRATCRSLNDSFILNSTARKALVLTLGLNQTTSAATKNCNELVYPFLDPEITRFLLGTFPAITHLEIRLHLLDPYSTLQYPQFLRQIAALLDGWSGTLESLDFYSFINFNLVRQHYTCLRFTDIHFPVCLNRLPALRSLYLTYYTKPPPSWYTLPILRQLEVFSLTCEDVMSSIYRSLLIYALPNLNLRTLSFTSLKGEYFESIPSITHPFLNLDASLTRKFTSLGNFAMPSTSLEPYASKFTSLKYLTIQMVCNHITTLHQVTSLLAAHMPQLEHLLLHINFIQFTPEPLSCTPMPSVKSLDLELSISDHSNLDKYLNPAITFPNLKSVKTTIKVFRCSTCGIAPGDGVVVPPVVPAIRRVCRELLERPLQGCTELSGSVEQTDKDKWSKIDEKIYQSCRLITPIPCITISDDEEE